VKKIILTGGGTAGHVTPHLAILPMLMERGWDISYIGSFDGIERSLIEPMGIPYYPIETGKLRRYFDIKNFTDPFRVIKGTFQAMKAFQKLKPNVVFSKGGFVSLPVTVAAKSKGVPVILHESDYTPGLANRLAMPFAAVVCSSFPETQNYIKKGKVIYTGNPIREELLKGDKEKGKRICGFDNNKETVLVIGGSFGAENINRRIREVLKDLTDKFNVIHICGKGNVHGELTEEGYRQFDYVKEELPHLFALADYIVSRSGANTIFEILALKKPNILIPLSKGSRGDQILNAKSFKNQGFSMVIPDDELTGLKLFGKLQELKHKKTTIIHQMENAKIKDSKLEILEIIEKTAKKPTQ
jgi:UDP-N-acetylglucosamine--N-acetylmuramyl-(pentapeptide) pyrophosphoryl-undecaprenol N-acetylglucosamine transferase